MLRVIVGVGIGMMDGGVETDLPIGQVPEDLRAPNSEFGVVIRGDRTIEVVPPDAR
jgi:hypothetical protein